MLDILDAATLRVVLERERARADRTRAPLSLVLFDLPPSPEGNGAQIVLSGHGARRLRCIDAVGRGPDGRLALMLPETGRNGAQSLAEQLLALLEERDRVSYEVLHYPESSSDDRDADDSRPGDHEGRGDGRGGSGGKLRDRRVPAAPRIEVSSVELPALRLVDDRSPVARRGAVNAPHEPLRPLFHQPLPAWKRTLDVVGSAALIVLTAPLMALTALAVKLTSPGPLIFRQIRSGIGGRPFTLYKFRTMCLGADAMKEQLLDRNEHDGPVFKLHDDPRVTGIGRLLRRTSIDELPQLFNVLKGEMSLVGPRPPIPSETDRYEQWQHRRLECTGGLTGIWQVSGRSEVDFHDWVRMDILYQRRRSVWTDLAILLRTIPAVVRGRGAC